MSIFDQRKIIILQSTVEFTLYLSIYEAEFRMPVDARASAHEIAIKALLSAANWLFERQYRNIIYPANAHNSIVCVFFCSQENYDGERGVSVITSSRADCSVNI